MNLPKKRRNVYAFDNSDDLESSHDEKDFETPNFVHLSDTSEIQDDTRNGIMDQLSRTIDATGAFNSYEAGSILYECYEMGFKNTNQIIDDFVSQNSGRIRDSVVPNLSQFNEENFQKKLTLGSFLTSKLVMTARANAKIQVEDLSIQTSMGKVGGSAANLTRAYFYPAYKPFSGDQIIIEVTPRSIEEPSHVVLKRVLVSILSKACTNQEEISDNWVVSGHGETGKKRIFPMDFYEELKVLCAEFFGLHHQVLNTEWHDSYSSLSFLASFPDSERETRFKKLQLAKEVFETKSFHQYFKEALREMRYGSFAPLQNGEKYRRFVLRQRSTRKSVNVAVCGEGQGNVASNSAGKADPALLETMKSAQKQQKMDGVDENVDV